MLQNSYYMTPESKLRTKVMEVARNFYKFKDDGVFERMGNRFVFDFPCEVYLINSTLDLGGFYIYDNDFLSILQVWEKDTHFRLADFLVTEMEKQLKNLNFNPDVFFLF